ncbi:MAG TPA: hypothetical protein VMY42_01335 [Thermoguttaceae bacterium]|nr:hypothetical protein [Thermoguttaceae bacterium]
MSKYPSNRPLAAAALLLGVCLGCGTGEYETRLDETVERIQKESDFGDDICYEPQKLAETAVWFQVPKNFAETSLQEASIKELSRVQLPENLNSSIPGLQWTYEGWFSYDAEEGPDSGKNPKTAYYCYLSATDLLTSTTKDPMRTVRNNLDRAGSSEKSAKIVSCKTPEGRSVTWTMTEYIIQDPLQDFYHIDEEGNGQFTPMGGTLIFYGRTDEERNLAIIVGFRVPTKIWELKGFSLKERVALVPGSIKIDEPAED